MGISSYSTTPSANTSISGINIAEGCLPGNINDALRQLMADVATDVRPQQAPTATGTASAIVVALAPAVTSYAGGQKFEFIPIANSTGATTINYGGGAIALKKIGAFGAVALAQNDIVSGILAQVEHDGTQAILLNPNPNAKGADIASIATLNLNNATGNYVAITGTTGITAITLAEGREVTTRFDGAVLLTNSASLICPGNTNFTTAAGDVIVWRGESSGVVRAVGGMKADGSAFAVSASNGVPTGAVYPFAGSSAPTGYLLCYGQAVSRTTYAALFAAIGINHGSGDGSTTFNIPDLRGRVAAGKDDMGGSAANRITSGGSGITGTTLGATGGAQTVTLTSGEMPSHSHTGSTDSQGAHTHAVDLAGPDSGSGNYVKGSNDSSPNGSDTTSVNSNGAHTHTLSLNNTGSGGAHQNTQPTIILNYIIKT